MPGELQFISHQRHTVFSVSNAIGSASKIPQSFPNVPTIFGIPHLTLPTLGSPSGTVFLHMPRWKELPVMRPPASNHSATVASVVEWCWRFPGIGLCRSQAHTPDVGSTCPLKWGELHQKSREVGPYWRSLNVIGIIWRWCKVLRELKTYNTSNTTWQYERYLAVSPKKHLTRRSLPMINITQKWMNKTKHMRTPGPSISPKLIPPKQWQSIKFRFTIKSSNLAFIRWQWQRDDNPFTYSAILADTEKCLACHFCGDVNLFCLKHLWQRFFSANGGIKSNCVLCFATTPEISWDANRLICSSQIVFSVDNPTGKFLSQSEFFGHFNVQKPSIDTSRTQPTEMAIGTSLNMADPQLRWFEATANLRALGLSNTPDAPIYSPPVWSHHNRNRK